MKLNDLKNKLMQRFSGKAGNETRRPDGGTSCYRPIRKKTQAEEKEEQPLTYIHTGFTGMTPPADRFDTGFGLEGYRGQPEYDPNYGQQAAWAPNNGQQTAWNPNYGQQAPWTPNNGQQTGYAPGYGQEWSTAYQPAPRTVQQAPYDAPRASRIRTEEPPAAAARPQRGWFPPREEAVPRSNISYMPGYAPDAGAAPYNHVEHILTLTGLKSCYEAIECMKNGETLLVELGAIANEGESMRCQDMLAGAAFTLGCSVRMLQGARLVLIAPEGVKILPEEAPARMEPAQAPYMQAAPAAAPAPAEPEVRPRERRSGRNAADWEAARSGRLDHYNPYTGTMPVAAGAYAGFGGYGT